MNNYLQIIKRAQEQGLNFDNKHILIPLAENKFELDGEACFGRMFNDEIVYVIQDVDDNFSANEFVKEPFLYRIVDKYSTYLSNGTMSYLVEFYTVE